MLVQQTFADETDLFKHTGRRRVVDERVRGDFGEPKLLKTVSAVASHNVRHDAAAPVGFRQPVAEFGAMRLSDFDVIVANAADQSGVAFADSKVHRLALLLRV